MKLVLNKFQINSFTEQKQILGKLPEFEEKMRRETRISDQLIKTKFNLQKLLLDLKHEKNNSQKTTDHLNSSNCEAIKQNIMNKIITLRKSLDETLSKNIENPQKTGGKILNLKIQYFTQKNLFLQNKAQNQSFKHFKKVINNEKNYFSTIIQKTKEKISSLKKELNEYPFECEIDTRQLQTKAQKFIEYIQSKYPDSISSEEVSFIRNYQFSHFTVKCLSEVSKHQEAIRNLRTQLQTLRIQYLEIESKMAKKSIIHDELSNQQRSNARYQRQLKELKAFNDNLTTNMDRQIELTTNEKFKAMNQDKYHQVNRYLRTVDYLYQKFGSLLSEEDNNQIGEKLKNRIAIAQEKLKKNIMQCM